MPDQFKEVTRTGLGGRLGNSIKMVVAGFVMFVVSFGVLYWNEGRTDMSIVAKTAVSLKADVVDVGANGKLVAVAGKIATTGYECSYFIKAK
jgi:hypothetical protein